MNYATSCIDLIHKLTPSLDGIARGLTEKDRAALRAQGVKGFDPAPQSSEPVALPSRETILDNSRLTRDSIRKARDEMFARGYKGGNSGGAIKEMAYAHGITPLQLRHSCAQKLRRMAKSSAAGKARYVISAKQFAQRGGVAA